MTVYRYTAFGLEIDSELELPWLLPGSERSPDVAIRLGDVPHNLTNPIGKAWYFEATSDSFLFRIKDTARYLIVDGREITIDRQPGWHEDVLRTFLMGSGFGALLHQRGLLVMHAASIQTTQGAVLFAGPSGHGKSTLLAAMVDRGYAMLADDVTAIDVETTPGPLAYPAFPRTRLSAGSIDRLGLPAESLPKDWHRDKYQVPVENFCAETLPVHAIYDLDVHQAPDIRVDPVGGAQRFGIVTNNTYRYGFLETLGLRQIHFQSAARLARAVDVNRITRPESPFLIDQLVDRLQQELGEPINSMQKQEVG